MTLFPGSSVATSLCEGEAAQKHVAILNIYQKKFKVTPIPLKTVRPFVFDTIVLADCTIDLSTEKPSEEVSWYSCSVVAAHSFIARYKSCEDLMYGRVRLNLDDQIY